jgi:DNA replication protein DnaC
MNHDNTVLCDNLTELKLPCIKKDFDEAAKLAARKEWAHVNYLSELVQREVDQRKDRTIQNRIKQARFPVVKTLDTFDWAWPKKINRPQIQNLFRLSFITKKTMWFLWEEWDWGKAIWSRHWDIKPV